MIFLLFVQLLMAGSRPNAMNDISFEKYKSFNEKWKLVTVRYRSDTNEQRFVYANDIAFKALKNKSKNYPDGAVFGKIGFTTHDDPTFISSKVPSGVSRHQLMVRNKKKYASTGGWGYALFSSDGYVLAEDVKMQTKACYACHQIVPGRGEVFSQPMSFSHKKSPEVTMMSRLAFSEKKPSELPSNIRKYFNKKVVKVKSVEGKLRKNVFQGTLDEMKPTLLTVAMNSGLPAIFMSEDSKKFVIALEISQSSKSFPNPCGSKKFFKVFWTFRSQGRVWDKKENKIGVKDGHLCI